MDNQFLRTQMLLGGDAMNQLHRSHVAVFGLGGVGSYAVEALVRSGVGELTLIDDDTVSPTNLNRQLEALHSTVGQNKTDALAARCRDINPDVRLHLICARYDAAHREDFFTARYDYILDAIDTVSSKLDLIQTAQAQGIPMATTFCTNHVRQVGVAISKAIRHKDKSPYVSRMLLHLGMLGMFLAGVISSVLLAGVFLGKAMFFALIPLGIIAADLLHADLTTEKNILDRKPHGH